MVSPAVGGVTPEEEVVSPEEAAVLAEDVVRRKSEPKLRDAPIVLEIPLDIGTDEAPLDDPVERVSDLDVDRAASGDAEPGVGLVDESFAIYPCALARIELKLEDQPPVLVAFS
jgi:hypothetical protein